MCGIVGHVGPRNSVDVIIEGLRRLEYRGYDSAGICFVNESGDLQLFKKEGKIANLEALLGNKNYPSEIGIGHTRWATHGGVSDINAHPHQKGDIALVHNGIIENYARLREELVSEGVEFESETDTEVFFAMIVKNLDRGLDFFKAVAQAFKKVEGNSAFVVLNPKNREIIAVKRSAPLVCGISDSDSQALVSSDPYALIGHANKIYFPEDEVICSLSGANKNLISFFELDGSPSRRYLSKHHDASLEVADKGEFEHFMLKEIYEQPGLIRALTQYYFHGDGKPWLRAIADLKATRIYSSACGTAYYAGLLIKEFFESYNRIPNNVEYASEFRYRNPIINNGDLGLFISQSGETADTLAAQQLCSENMIKTIAIVNVEGSTLYRDCDFNLLIRAGTEIGVASTKAFTQQVLTGRLMSLALSEQFLLQEEKNIVEKKFNLLAQRADELLENSSLIKKIAQRIYARSGFFFTGRGPYYPVALEGALKLKEIAYVHAEGYPAGELKHGPIALIDENMVNIAIVGPELYDKTVSNLQEIKARQGIIVTIGPEGDTHLEEMSDYYIPMNFDGLDELRPLYVNMANQLLAYYMAKNKGTDIDKPRNLAKSVTVE